MTLFRWHPGIRKGLQVRTQVDKHKLLDVARKLEIQNCGFRTQCEIVTQIEN